MQEEEENRTRRRKEKRKVLSGEKNGHLYWLPSPGFWGRGWGLSLGYLIIGGCEDEDSSYQH